MVDFLAPADGRIALPTSDASLRIDRVDWTPEPIGESFAAGVRSFVFPPGTRAAARLRFRTFAPPGGEAASAAATLPHAIALRLADAP